MSTSRKRAGGVHGLYILYALNMTRVNPKGDIGLYIYTFTCNNEIFAMITLHNDDAILLRGFEIFDKQDMTFQHFEWAMLEIFKIQLS